MNSCLLFFLDRVAWLCLTGRPVVSITCSTPCVVCLCVIDVPVISENLFRISLYGQSSANAIKTRKNNSVVDKRVTIDQMFMPYVR